MSCIPGWACRSRAMRLVTLRPGSWPPSPGFEPCAILISSSSARFRYRGVTPKRADATCFTLLSCLTPSRSSYVSGSSPPSPELDLAPTWFIAIARASCASGESAPSDIAVLTKRLTTSLAGSTSSSGTGCVHSLSRISSRSDCGWSMDDRRRHSPYASASPVCAAFCAARTARGLYAWCSPALRKRTRPWSASGCGRPRLTRSMSSRSAPPTRDGTAGKHISMTSAPRPSASRTSAPR